MTSNDDHWINDTAAALPAHEAVARASEAAEATERAPFTQSDMPGMLIGAAEFARRFDAPFFTVVEFINSDGERDYYPVRHPGYNGDFADTPERAEALRAAVLQLLDRPRRKAAPIDAEAVA